MSIFNLVLLLKFFTDSVFSIDICDDYCLNERSRIIRSRSRLRSPMYFTANSDVNNFNCGKQYFRPSIQQFARLEFSELDDRIVGGTPAFKGEFPWMVSIEKPLKDGLKHFCAGAIISDYFILTAAHCGEKFVGFEGLLRIRVGVTNRSNPKEGYYLRVSQIILHDGWDRETSVNDIALYKTDRPIKYEIVEETGQYLVNSICLPLQSYKEPDFGIVTGWGQYDTDNAQSKILQKLTIPKYSWFDCKDHYKYLSDINENMICYGGEGSKDSCKGDSGGPLAEKRGNQYFVFGLVSYGIPCAQPDYPTVFTKVSSYLDWVYDQI